MRRDTLSPPRPVEQAVTVGCSCPGAAVPQAEAASPVDRLPHQSLAGPVPAERRLRRLVLLNLEVERDLRDAGRTDQIRQTLHYKRIFEVVEDVAKNQEHRLMEGLGERIARAVLSKFDADAVTVTVRKPKPIAGFLDHAGVRIRRTREDVS